MVLKSKNVIRCLVFLVGILHAVASVAQNTMSWEDCITETAKRNPEIAAAVSTLSSSQSKAKAAYSGFLPQLSGNVNYNSGNFSAGSSGSFTTDTYSASVTANQNVFSGFHDYGLVRQTEATVDANRSGLENTKIKISYDLKSAFSQMLYAQNNSKLQDEIIKRRTENSGLVSLRFEAGMENKGNALLSQALLSQAKYDKRQAERSIGVARQQLAKVIGMEDDTGLLITGKIPISDPEGIRDPFSIVRENPQYQKAVAQERAARAGVTLAKSAFSPTFNISASAAKQGDTFSMPQNNTTWGFNVGLPIFNGANNIFTLESSHADLSTAKANKANTENDLIAKVKQFHSDFVNAYEKLKVDKEFLEAATVRADIARNRYKNGLLTFDNWDIIENDLIGKQQQYILSEKNLYVAEAAWMQAAGKGVFK